MKKILRKLTLVSLALLMLLSFAACSKPGNTSDTGSNTTQNPGMSTDASDVTSALPDSNLEIKINVLNGTTALGMAQLISKVSDKTAGMNYNIETFTAADAITGAIVSGECAIAALPTNVAAKLYKASNGKVQMLAVNTLGVLYLLQNGTQVTDFESLRGKTVYLPGAGSNPEYITAALLSANGLTVGKDVFLDTTSYNSPDALQTAIVSGNVDLAVLPEPKVTVVLTKNSSVSVAMNFTEKWEEKFGANTLVQGCLVVNTAFAQAHPVEISKFLDDYKASVEYISAGSDDAISMIVSAGILPNETIAKKALPGCNICFLEGAEMKSALVTFYEKIYAANPASIAAIPDDGFYYAR